MWPFKKHKHTNELVKEFVVETTYMTYNWRISVLYCSECGEYYCQKIKILKNNTK